MDYKYNAIILNKRNVGEADRIYTFYTREEGKVKALGKGVRRSNAKLAGGLEPITQAEIFVAKSRGMGKITGSIVENNFSGIKGDFDLLEKVFYVFKILERIIAEQEKDEKIFELIVGFLKGMEKTEGQKDKTEIITLGFLFKVLSELGYQLEMGSCVNCGKKLKSVENNYFSISRGGVLCGDCQHLENKRIKVSNESIKLIRIFLQNKPENLAKLKVSSADINNLRLIAQEAVNWL
jgi:DNA repair protein RecO (recombination protein O)